jgi:hypothetical protein
MTVIGSVEFEASLSLDKFNRDINNLIAKNKGLIIPVNAVLNFDAKNQITKIGLPPLKVKVDDKELTRLNQHIELKRKHHKEVQQYFNSNPLAVKVNKRGIDDSIQAIKMLKEEIKTVRELYKYIGNTNITGGSVKGSNYRSPSGSGTNSSYPSSVLLTEIGESTLTKLEVILGKAIRKNSPGGFLKTAIGFGLGGLLLPLTKNIGVGISDALTEVFSGIIGDFELVGSSIGRGIGENFLLIIEKNLYEIIRDAGKGFFGEEQVRERQFAARSSRQEKKDSIKTRAFNQSQRETSPNSPWQTKINSEVAILQEAEKEIQKYEEQISEKAKSLFNAFKGDKIEEELKEIEEKSKGIEEKLLKNLEERGNLKPDDTSGLSKSLAENKSLSDSLDKLARRASLLKKRHKETSESVENAIREQVRHLEQLKARFKDQALLLLQASDTMQNAYANVVKLRNSGNKTEKEKTGNSQVFETKAQRNLFSLIQIIAQQTGLKTPLKSETPKIIPMSENDMRSGAYSPDDNFIRLSEEVIKAFDSIDLEGLLSLSEEKLNIVVHELIHAFQYNFGKEGASSSSTKELMTIEDAKDNLSEEQLRKINRGVSISVRSYQNSEIREKGKSPSIEELEKVKRQEMDAYIRAELLTRKVLDQMTKKRQQIQIENQTGFRGGRIPDFQSNPVKSVAELINLSSQDFLTKIEALSDEELSQLSDEFIALIGVVKQFQENFTSSSNRLTKIKNVLENTDLESTDIEQLGKLSKFAQIASNDLASIPSDLTELSNALSELIKTIEDPKIKAIVSAFLKRIDKSQGTLSTVLKIQSAPLEEGGVVRANPREASDAALNLLSDAIQITESQNKQEEAIIDARIKYLQEVIKVEKEQGRVAVDSQKKLNALILKKQEIESKKPKKQGVDDTPIKGSVEPPVVNQSEPIIEPIVKPIIEPVIEPVIEPIIEPIIEPVIEPIIELVDIPFSEKDNGEDYELDIEEIQSIAHDLKTFFKKDSLIETLKNIGESPTGKTSEEISFQLAKTAKKTAIQEAYYTSGSSGLTSVGKKKESDLTKERLLEKSGFKLLKEIYKKAQEGISQKQKEINNLIKGLKDISGEKELSNALTDIKVKSYDVLDAIFDAVTQLENIKEEYSIPQSIGQNIQGMISALKAYGERADSIAENLTKEEAKLGKAENIELPDLKIPMPQLQIPEKMQVQSGQQALLGIGALGVGVFGTQGGAMASTGGLAAGSVAASPIVVPVVLTLAAGAGAIAVSKAVQPFLERNAPEIAKVLYFDIGKAIKGFGVKVKNLLGQKTPAVLTPTTPDPSTSKTPPFDLVDIENDINKKEADFFKDAIEEGEDFKDLLIKIRSNIESLIDGGSIDPSVLIALNSIEENIEKINAIGSDPFEFEGILGLDGATEGLDSISEALVEIAANLPPDAEKAQEAVARMLESVGKLENVESGLDRQETRSSSPLKRFIDEIKSLSDISNKKDQPFLSLLVKFRRAFVSFNTLDFFKNQFQNIASGTFEVTKRFQVLENTINFLSGGTKAGAKQIAFLRSEIERTSSAIEPALQSYKKLAASTRNTPMEGKITNQLMSGLMQAGTVFGLTGEELEGSILAISQIAGKGCHGKGSLIRMADGSTKKVENIKVGDYLMGVDKTPRKVLMLAHGTEELWNIKPKHGDSFVVNRSHKMRLFDENGVKNTVNLFDYIELSPKEKANYKLINEHWNIEEFTIERLNVGEFFGFFISGDHLYLDAQGYEHHNTVSMEELRGQLAERIPGAFQIAARSMNLTEQELFKLIATGQLAATDFLPKFANQLSSETAGGVAGASNTAQSSLTRLKTAITEIQVAAGKEFQGILITGMNVLSGVIKGVTQHAGTFSQIIQTATAVALGRFLPSVVRLVKGLWDIHAVSFTVTKAVRGLRYAINNFIVPSVAKFATVTAVVWLTIEAFKVLASVWDAFASKTQSQTWSETLSKNLQKNKDDVKELWKEIEKSNKTNTPRNSSERPKTEVDIALEEIKSQRKKEGVLAKVNRLINPLESNPYVAWLNPFKGQTVEQDKKLIDAINQANKDSREVKTLQQDRVSGALKGLKDQIDSGSTQENVKRLKDYNTQIESLRQKASLTTNPGDQKQIKDQITQIRAFRDVFGADLASGMNEVNAQIENRQKRIKGTSSDKLREELRLDLVELQKLKDKLQDIERQTGAQTTLSELMKVLANIRVEMEMFNRVASELADKNLRAIAETEFKGFTKDVFAASSASLKRSENALELVNNKINISKNAVKGLKELLQDPMFSQYTANYGGDSLERLKIELEGVDEADTQRRKALEALILLREQESSLIGLQREQAEATLALEKEKSQTLLSRFDYYKAEAQNKIQIGESKDLTKIARDQLKGYIAPAQVDLMKGEISLNVARQNEAFVKKQLETIQSYYKQGKISAEDFANRRRELESEVAKSVQQVAEQELQVRQQKQQVILDMMDREIAKLDHQLKLREMLTQINQKNSQIQREVVLDTRTRSGEDAQTQTTRQTEDETLAVQFQTSTAYEQELQRRLSILQSHYAKREITQREYEDRSRQIEQDITSTTLQLKDYELQQHQRINQRTIEDRDRMYSRMVEDFERATKKQENILQLSAIRQEQIVRQKQLGQIDLIGSQRAEQQAAIALTQMQGDQAKKQLKETLTQIKQVAKLRQQNALTEREAEERTADLTIKAEQLKLDLINKQIEKVKQLKDLKILALDDESSRIDLIFQQQEMGYSYGLEKRKQIVESLDREKTVMEAQVKLQQSLFKGEEQRRQAALDRSRSAEDLLGRLPDLQKRAADNSINFAEYKGTRYLMDLIRKMAGAGSGSTFLSESDIRDLRTKQFNQSALEEKKLLEMKTRQLEQQQKIQNAQMQLQKVINKLTAENAIMEASISLNKARQAELQAKIALEKANVNGDPREIQNAQQAYELTKQGTQLSQQQLGIAVDKLTVSNQIAGIDQQALASDQNNERFALQEANRKALQDTALRGGELASQGAINVDQIIQVDMSSIKFDLSPITPMVDLTSQINTKLDSLLTAIEGLINKPTAPNVENLTVVSSDPTGDSRQVLADWTRAKNMY